MFNGENEVHFGIKHARWVCDGFCYDIYCFLVVADLSYRCGDVVSNAIGGEEFTM